MPKRQPGQPKARRYDPLAVLDYVSQYQRQSYGRSPSQRQIQRALDISAPSVVHNILHRLERRGLLQITIVTQGVTADLEITEVGQAALELWQGKHTRRDNGSPGGP